MTTQPLDHIGEQIIYGKTPYHLSAEYTAWLQKRISDYLTEEWKSLPTQWKKTADQEAEEMIKNNPWLCTQENWEKMETEKIIITNANYILQKHFNHILELRSCWPRDRDELANLCTTRLEILENIDLTHTPATRDMLQGVMQRIRTLRETIHNTNSQIDIISKFHSHIAPHQQLLVEKTSLNPEKIKQFCTKDYGNVKDNYISTMKSLLGLNYFCYDKLPPFGSDYTVIENVVKVLWLAGTNNSWRDTQTAKIASNIMTEDILDPNKVKSLWDRFALLELYLQQNKSYPKSEKAIQDLIEAFIVNDNDDGKAIINNPHIYSDTLQKIIEQKIWEYTTIAWDYFYNCTYNDDSGYSVVTERWILTAGRRLLKTIYYTPEQIQEMLNRLWVLSKDHKAHQTAIANTWKELWNDRAITINKIPAFSRYMQ